MDIKIGQNITFNVNNFYTGWKNTTRHGILRRFHAPGWVTIWMEDEKQNYYIQYKDIIAAE